MTKKNKLVGLIPYQEENSNIFFGREKEIENLLQIIQKNKLISLTGTSGSGKTSLINAGIIPRLKNGFLGQAGKDWAVCKFRPGVSPIDNMIGALTTSGVFNMDLRSNTEDFLNYKKIIEVDKALSLSKIYRDSEINNNKNLLIVVDQLEDLFLFNGMSTQKEGEDQLLLNIISRTVRIKETSIYFLICLQTEHISKLGNHSNLQELFSKSQYSIQNIGRQGIKSIIKSNFTANGIGFESAAYNAILEPITQNSSLLPNIQFLLYRLLREKKEITTVNEELINELGGVKNVIANKLEEVFNSLTLIDQKKLSEILKATMNFKNPENQFFANSFENILNISGVEKTTAERLIFLLQKDFGSSVSNFEEKISGIQNKSKKTINPDEIISFKYQKYRNWKQEESWVDAEKSAFHSFTDYALMADKHSMGEISFMSSPELEMAIHWRDLSIQNENWAKKYSFNYTKTIKYINESEKTFNNNKFKEERRIKQKKRITKIVIMAISTLTIVAFIMAIGAFINKAEAEKNYNEAKLAKNLAEKKSIEADNARKVASENALMAIEEKKLANYAKVIAQNSLKESVIAQRKAVQSAMEAEKQKKLAKASELIAMDKQNEALIQKEIATKAKDEAEKLKEIALLETKFYPLMLQLERLAEESSYQKSNDIILSSIEEALKKYYEYEILMEETNSGKTVTEGLYILLQTALRVLENKNTYRETSMLIKKISPSASIRSISTYNDNIVALGGDNQYLYILNGATKTEITPIKINERIRKVVIANTNEIFVGTFKGNVYKIDLSATTSRERKNLIYKATTPIKNLHYNANSNQLYIVSSQNIFMFDGSSTSLLMEGNTLNSSRYNQDSNALYISTDKGIFIQSGKQSNPIVLEEINFNSEKITAILVAEKRLFLGTNSGQLYIYRINNLSSSSSSFTFENKIVLHRSEITKLFYDKLNKNLYSASFDNQVLKYNTSLEDIEKITNSAISLMGHEKWVWDINLIKDQEGNDLVITADENGNLLSWYDSPDRLVNKIETLVKIKRQENRD